MKTEVIILAILLAMSGPAVAGDDAQMVGALDTRYQAAVKANDAATMAEILHDRFTLVTGNGRIYDKAALLESARNKTVVYTAQDEEPGSQTVRLLGNTAVVTAKLHIAGHSGGTDFDKWLWFSDTYVRGPDGWRYFFGQSSLALPPPGDHKPR